MTTYFDSAAHDRALEAARIKRTMVMKDTCTITRAGVYEWDPANPTAGVPDNQVIYEGPVQFKQYAPGVRMGSEDTAAIATVTTYVFVLPYDSAQHGVTEMDTVEYNGRSYPVSSIDRGTSKSATRILAVEQTASD